MADEAGPSTQDSDAVAGDITTRERLSEALHQTLREKPTLLQATTGPMGPPSAHFSRNRNAVGTSEIWEEGSCVGLH